MCFSDYHYLLKYLLYSQKLITKIFKQNNVEVSETNTENIIKKSILSIN